MESKLVTINVPTSEMQTLKDVAEKHKWEIVANPQKKEK